MKGSCVRYVGICNGSLQKRGVEVKLDALAAVDGPARSARTRT